MYWSSNVCSSDLDTPRCRRRFDAHVQLREDRGGGAGVRAFEETVDVRDAVGQRRQHHRAVRDRLVARNHDFPPQGRSARGDPSVALAAAHRAALEKLLATDLHGWTRIRQVNMKDKSS